MTASKTPSYCCQSCGELIGWLGRLFQFMGITYLTPTEGKRD